MPRGSELIIYRVSVVIQTEQDDASVLVAHVGDRTVTRINGNENPQGQDALCLFPEATYRTQEGTGLWLRLLTCEITWNMLVPLDFLG
jgi:hypothetical protein